MRTSLFVLSALIVLGLAAPTVTVSIASEEIDPAVVKALYNKKCSLCHGKDGIPKKRGGDSASFQDSAWQAETSIEDIVAAINEGRGEGKYKMKPLKGKLTEAEIRAIAEFVKGLEKK